LISNDLRRLFRSNSESPVSGFVVKQLVFIV
jgi:hypothetical protein